jgi:hypothetical protein
LLDDRLGVIPSAALGDGLGNIPGAALGDGLGDIPGEALDGMRACSLWAVPVPGLAGMGMGSARELVF